MTLDWRGLKISLTPQTFVSRLVRRSGNLESTEFGSCDEDAPQLWPFKDCSLTTITSLKRELDSSHDRRYSC